MAAQIDLPLPLPDGPPRLRSKGEHHDLGAILQRVNDRYFRGRVSVSIGWGPRRRGRRAMRRSIRLGSYDCRRRVIRINPALDAAWVPEFFVAYVVYHEVLHHMLPVTRSGQRRVIHSRTFHALEREFAHYDKARRWQRRHLVALLGA